MKSKPAKHQSYFLYVLRCVDGSLYTGVAKDVSRRLAEHRRGRGSKYVRSRLPVTIFYSERLLNRSRALKREAEIKCWTRSQKLTLREKRRPQ